MNNKITYEYREHLIERQEKAEIAMLEEFKSGIYTIDKPLIKYNPYFLNALSAVILFRTEEEVAISLTIKGKTREADISHVFPRAKQHILPVIGLYGDYENKVEIYEWQNPNKKFTHLIKTPKLKDDGLVESIDTSSEYMDGKLMFLTPAVLGNLKAIDYKGDTRVSFTIPCGFDFKRVENGNFRIGSERLIKTPYFMTGIYELSLVGKIYKEYRVKNGYHHDSISLANGDIVALNSSFREGVVEDQVLILDKDTGLAKKTIDIDDYLVAGMSVSGSWKPYDWFHANALAYDENTNSLLISARHYNAIISIDLEKDKLNWILGDHQGYSKDYQKYLFKPIGEDFEWNYEQHGLVLTPRGEIMCFDNHRFGSKIKENYLKAEESYSRGVKFRIDTKDMTISQVWQYGKERGSDFVSPYIGNVHYYDEGHYMVHSGGIVRSNQDEPSLKTGPTQLFDDHDSLFRSVTVEIKNGKKEYELKMNNNYFRAYKDKPYSDKGNDLKLGRAMILGRLGIEQEDYLDLGLTKEAGFLPKDHQAKLVEDIDTISLYARIDNNQLAYLVLEGPKDVRTYKIDTTKGNKPAFRMGRPLPADERDKLIIVRKEGLNGRYRLGLVIEDKKYDTGLVLDI